MRVVLDTNTVVSGFLRDNEPRAIVDAAIDGRIELFTYRIPILNATDALHSIEQQTRNGISS